MLKKTITYTDYNGTERKEDFYFNMTKAELMEMELGTDGGMENLIQTVIDKQDIPRIMSIFKEIILKSYGEKSPDGKRFIKSEELSQAFAQTEAYSELFVELLSDAKAAADFMNGIVPAEIAKQASESGRQNLLKEV